MLIILLKLIVIVKLPLLPHGISLINPKKKKKMAMHLQLVFGFHKTLTEHKRSLGMFTRSIKASDID